MCGLVSNQRAGTLLSLIERVDAMLDGETFMLSAAAKTRIDVVYSWQFIADEYGSLFHRNYQ